MWARHLQLEVGVMGYGHEAGEGSSSENCVVLRIPVDHFEIQRLLAEIGRAPEDYFQAYPSHGVDCFSWYDPMESCDRRLESIVLDQHVIECSSEYDVDSTAAVHEHSRHVVVSDPCLQDQCGTSWSRDDWWVVVPGESYFRFRPAQVFWDGWVCGCCQKDLSGDLL